MLSNRFFVLAITALAPALWGTTYLTTTALLPPDRPLLAATLRALPAGLLLLLICRRLPQGAWWGKSWVLGVLNIGAFFALLFVAAYRLPGGVAAIVGGIQPLVIALLASRVLHERLTTRVVVAGATGVLGVALIVLQAQARLDPLGLLAAVGGTLAMASGIVLAKKWGQPAPPLTTTAWQLVTGGLTLLVVMLLVEGLPTEPLTGVNLAGYAYLSVFGTAVAYVLWFRGLARMPAGTTAFLGLLSPIVAILLGWGLAGEVLSGLQLLGIVVVLASIAAAVARPRASVDGVGYLPQATDDPGRPRRYGGSTRWAGKSSS
ncbi:EamA family transporter [Cryobacterium frigoriphilum]|uniref:EamA family transporter n=1 Tax=Cryobacterium frigoriphilum TaxID=1259150 RepID=A0A4R9A4V8_9MICO|nr:EamA family transporter [Cryobacterium frigoriphilum]TFD52246.1 EamA family transporter [Cryobacterium frigoriphilum]